MQLQYFDTATQALQTRDVKAGDVIRLRPLRYSYKAVVQGKTVSKSIKGPPYLRAVAGIKNGLAAFENAVDPGDSLVEADILQVSSYEAQIKIRWDTPTRLSDKQWFISSRQNSPVLLNPKLVYM